MSSAEDKLFPQNLSLLALKGEITVHFLDNEVIEGEFITQDLFNIFLMVDGEHLMIPRSQIRFIKGKHNQQIEEDTSLERLLEAEAVGVVVPESYRSDTKEYATEGLIDAVDSGPLPADDQGELTFLLSEDQTSTLEADDGTVVLPSEADGALSGAEAKDEEETFVLPSETADFAPLGEDDDATFVLASAADQVLEEDEDGTVVLTATTTESVTDDMPEDEAEDATVVIPQDEARISASLICTAGPHSGQVFRLEADLVSVGRSSDNAIALSSDKEISRHHALISMEAGKYAIQDQNSLNGTFVNNEAVTEARILEDNDMILVGISTLRFQVDS